MGNFANTLFSTLLGWLRSAAAWLWSFLNNQESGGFILWIADNWLVLVILLCVTCMAVDFIVYMFRWQPYKVWASFFRRLFSRDREDQDARRIRRRWIHADGTTSIEEVDPSEVMPEPEPQSLFAPPVEEMPVAEPYARFAQPLTYDAPETAEEAAPAQEEPIEDAVPAASEPTQGRPGGRFRRFSQTEEELPLNYAPPPATDNATDYHEPYYPPQWKRPADTGASGIDAGGSA